jgi:hypothetical protein
MVVYSLAGSKVAVKRMNTGTVKALCSAAGWSGCELAPLCRDYSSSPKHCICWSPVHRHCQHCEWCIIIIVPKFTLKLQVNVWDFRLIIMCALLGIILVKLYIEGWSFYMISGITIRVLYCRGQSLWCKRCHMTGVRALSGEGCDMWTWSCCIACSILSASYWDVHFSPI